MTNAMGAAASLAGKAARGGCRPSPSSTLTSDADYAGTATTATLIRQILARFDPPATLSYMHPELKTLHGLEELERELAASGDRPLLLFKHSFTCGVSAEALDELVTHLNGRPAEATYAMVTVQTHREVSNAVARKLGVRHETPQALLVRDGRVVWSASHFRVTAAAVEDAIQRHPSGA